MTENDIDIDIDIDTLKFTPNTGKSHNCKEAPQQVSLCTSNKTQQGHWPSAYEPILTLADSIMWQTF